MDYITQKRVSRWDPLTIELFPHTAAFINENPSAHVIGFSHLRGAAEELVAYAVTTLGYARASLLHLAPNEWLVEVFPNDKN